MGKQVEIEIKEDVHYLKTLRKKENNHRLKTRIQSLILTKENRFSRRIDLANHLGIGIASLDRWTKVYKKSGLDSMLTISNGGIRRNSVPKEVHEGLVKKVYDSNNPFLGYWEAALWVRENYGIEIKYNTLRTYLIRHFKTKLKEPRKSHYKKMNRLLKPLKKLPNLLTDLRISLIKDKYESVNLYFQDESRFGLMTHMGRCLTAMGVKPIVKYQHAFKNTYLYGSFSPIDGDAFVYEIEGTTSEIFYKYLVEFSKHKPKELKVIVIDNAGFHSLQQYDIPKNIRLIRIPPYCPELNPSEKIWHYIKQKYKNKVFENLSNVKTWLHDFVRNELNQQLVMSITHDKLYNEAFINHLDI